MMRRDYRNIASDEHYHALCKDPSRILFSFVYGAKRYCGFSPSYFSLTDTEVQKGEGKETRILVFSFAECLQVRLVLSHYFTHGFTEWTVWFENSAVQTQLSHGA